MRICRTSSFNIFLISCLVILILAPVRVFAKKESASGPILRPIAWQGETCPLEAFGTMIFTAAETDANVTIRAETFTTHPDCDPGEIGHSIPSFFVMPRSVYDAHLVPTMAQGDPDRCLPQDYTTDIFDPTGTSPGDFILSEDFSTQLNGSWTFNGSEFFPGGGISFFYDPGVGDMSTAEVRLTGLTPGEEYAVTFTCRNSMPCDQTFYYSTMYLFVDTEPGILRVAADGSGDYLTIGSALAVAQSGETLLVSAGIYNESGLVLPAGVSIVGDSGIAQDVVIQASTSGNTLVCTNPTPGTRLANLTMSGAQASALVQNGGNLELENCRFLNNNHSGGEGGAINTGWGGGSILTLVGCEFVGNSSVSNGGAIRSIGTNLQIEDCIFQNNFAGINGGAIDAEADEIHIIGCLFEGNDAVEWGGGFNVQTVVSFSATDSRWTNNSAGYFGGGAVIDVPGSPVPILDGCTFSGNVANDGAACWLAVGGPGFTISGSAFVQNSALSTSTILSNGAPMFLDHCSFVDNAAPLAVIETYSVSEISINFTLAAFNSSPFLSGPDPSGMFNNDIFDNTGGNYVGTLASWRDVNENISLDPLFCDMAGGNVTLSLDSPCLPANNSVDYLIGAAAEGCAGESPLVTDISDVVNDQGGQARLTWLGSNHDVGAGPVITGYALYRRADFNKSGDKTEIQAGSNRLKLAGWDYLSTVPARGDTAYQTIVSTLCDSTGAGGICWSTFMVSAITSDPLTYFDSPPDSGYSVDNLSPLAPIGLVAGFDAFGVDLVWDASPDPDVHHYNVYRANAGYCDQAFGSPVAQVISPEWMDNTPGISFYQRCYAVTAVDFAGNESPESSWSDASVSSVPGAADGFGLRPGVPNPFNPRTTFTFNLDTPGSAALEVFDTRGRKVRTLVQGNVPAGSYEVDWFGHDDSGRRLASGVYLVRLRQANRVSLQRVTLLK